VNLTADPGRDLTQAGRQSDRWAVTREPYVRYGRKRRDLASCYGRDAPVTGPL
jgi:hypothetical protein